MKKTLTALLVCALLITGVFTTGFALAESEPVAPVTPQEEPLTPSLLLPKDSYMQLQSPRITKKDSEYFYIAGDRTLSVFKGSVKSEYIIATKADETIAAMVLAEKCAYVLTKAKYDYKLIKLDPLSGEQETVTPNGVNNIVGICSDGKTLYVRNSSSEFYKKEGESFRIIEGINTVITSQSKCDIVVSDRIYSLTGDNEIVAADTGETLLSNLDPSAKDFAFIGEDIYVLKDNALEQYIDKELFKSIHLPDKIASGVNDLFIYCKLVYLTSANDNRIYQYDLQLDSKGYYGDKGSEDTRLDNPSDISVLGNHVYIADTNNSRITVYNVLNDEISHVDVPVEPTMIAGIDGGFALVNGKNILLYKDSALSASIDMSRYDGIIDIVFTSNDVKVDENTYAGGTLFALLADGGIIAISLTAPYDTALSATAPGGRKLAAPEGSGRLYVLQQNIHRITLENGYNEDTGISGEDISDFIVDFAGNIFAVNTAAYKLTRYIKDGESYASDKEFTLLNVPQDSVTAFEFSKGKLMFVSPSAHSLTYLAADDIGAYSTWNSQYTPPTDYDILRLGLFNKDTIVYYSPNNTEAVRAVKSGGKFLILAQSEYNDTVYYYGITDNYGNYGYVLQSDIDICAYKTYAEKNITLTPMLHTGTLLYRYPYNYSGVIMPLGKGDKLSLLSDVASDDNGLLWDWYKVSILHEGGALSVGYVKVTDVQKMEESTPPKLKKYYKVRAEKVGVKVSMYKNSNETSEVLFDDIKDGTEVLVYQSAFYKDSEFTCVYYNDTIGFIKTANLIQSGLTVNQIIAVSISCVGIVIILIVTVILIKRMRRLKDNDIYN